jgi:multimeric flavodoxin WrbA
VPRDFKNDEFPADTAKKEYIQMKLIVLNGSPKADNSITVQHINYFHKVESSHSVEVIDIARKIHQIERKQDLFDQIVQSIHDSDAVIWSFPVYYTLVPAQQKRFIELLFQRCPKNSFKKKYTTVFTTSIHFFDHTAHNYMQGVCEELGFSFVKSYSAHMDDFFGKDKREKMLIFFKWFIEMVENNVPVQPKYNVKKPQPVAYQPGAMVSPPARSDQTVLILTDGRPEDTNLNRMVDTFITVSRMSVTVKNIRDIGMKNGCLGCCICGYDNTCKQKDGYRPFIDKYLMTSDIIIIAGTIRDHYLSAVWKTFIDRFFFNGHAPVLQGRRMGFIVSGALSQFQNLRESLEAIAHTWHMKTYGFVTDEHVSSERITTQIKAFEHEIAMVSKNDVEFSTTFYRAAGRLFFRDFIYTASGVFKADHQFYKQHGIYDSFPQKKIKKRIKNQFFLLLMHIGPVRKKIHERFIQGMVAPYKKVLKHLK